MANPTPVTSTGNRDIDALFAGARWDSTTITYSFPADNSGYSYGGDPREYQNSFAQMPSEAQTAVRQAFGLYSSYTNLTFVEASGATDLRLALADTGSGGRGWDPGAPSERSGDVYLDEGQDWSFVAIPSSKFATIVHEIGHALGLSHPGLQMDPAKVSKQYTIMAYPPYPDHPEPNTSPGPDPTTLMQLDIAALQHMYGANFRTNAGDTVYRWDNQFAELSINGVLQPSSDFRSRPDIYMTLWDGGGIDTYDFSNFSTGSKVDLRPGEWSTPSETMLPFAFVDFERIPMPGSIANALLFRGDTRSLIENAIGGNGNDSFIGNQANNVLTGNGGDDTFFYTSGNDTFHGDAKRTGGAGDTADFSMSSAGVVITPVAVTTTVRIGTTVITVPLQANSALADTNSRYQVVNTFGGASATLFGIENLVGSAFADTITGDGSDNTIDAGGGNDTVFYTGGVDNLNGGDGIDTLNFSLFSSAVSVRLASTAATSDTTDWSTGTLRTIATLSSFEHAVGTSHNDRIFGTSAANQIDGGAGADRMFGFGGNDIYLVDNTGDVTIEGDEITGLIDQGGTDEVRSSVTFTLGRFIENLTLTGSSAVSGTGNNLNNIITGNAAANTLNGLEGNDRLNGLGGNDRLNGGLGNDTYVFAGTSQGSDIFTDTGGSDTVAITSLQQITSAARSGNDMVVTMTYGTFRVVNHFTTGEIEFVSDPLRTVVLAVGKIGGAASGIIAGTPEADFMDGGGGDDLLYGGNGNDELLGSAGEDLLDGGNGNDILDGGEGDDRLIGGMGNDVLRGGDGNDTLEGGWGIDRLEGGAGDDVLNAGWGIKQLFGGDGNDHLIGGAGFNTLVGGMGRDRLEGGLGHDRFVFDDIAESAVGSDRDMIFNFRFGDRIDVSAIDANTLLAGNQKFVFVGSADFKAAGQLRFAGGIVSGDVTGDGVADFEIAVNNVATMRSWDFIL